MAKNVSEKNPAPNFDSTVESVDTSGWSEERIGFAPYLKIVEGAKVVCKIDMKDIRNAAFERYVFVAMHDTHCQRGPVEGGESVLVHAGETFSISAFETLEEVFDEYLMSGIRPRLELTAKQKVKTSHPEGRKAWQWGLRVHPDDKKLLTAYRAEQESRKLSGNGTQARSLEA